MSRTLNKVMLIGNVGKEPELKYTPSGIPVTSFRLATSETWKDRDNNIQEHTDWHTIVAWRGLAEVIQKLVKKGSRVYIEGRIQTRSFDDKTGLRKHIVEILADNMLLLDARKGFRDDEFDSTELDLTQEFDSHVFDNHATDHLNLPENDDL
jgi:single-strand DNA-binding protein